MDFISKCADCKKQDKEEKYHCCCKRYCDHDQEEYYCNLTCHDCGWKGCACFQTHCCCLEIGCPISGHIFIISEIRKSKRIKNNTKE